MSKGEILLLAAVFASCTVLSLLIFFSFFMPEISPTTLKYFDREHLERAREYSQIKYIVYGIKQILVILALSALVLFFFRQGWIPFSGSNIYLQVPLYVFFIFLLLGVLTLPIDYYRGFVVEHNYGFSTQTAFQWFATHGKLFLINMFFKIIIITALYFLIRNIPQYWHFAAAAFFGVFLILQTILSPLFIDPLFHKYEPLPEGDLKQSVIAMADTVGIDVGEVLVMDASKRTTKANAYFTGIGETKRIVLYDNLLNNFSSDEVKNVIAHEIGHWKYAHILKGITLGIGGAFVFFSIYKYLILNFGISAGNPSTVPVLVLFLFVFLILTNPLQNIVSRHFERQADIAAVEITRDPDSAIDLRKNIAVRNMSDVQPHPFIKGLLFTHPSTLERIEAVIEWKEETYNND